MDWSSLVEALLLVTGGLVLFGVWTSSRRRDLRGVGGPQEMFTIGNEV